MRVGGRIARGMDRDPGPFVDKVETVPSVLSRVGSEHGVRAQQRKKIVEELAPKSMFRNDQNLV